MPSGTIRSKSSRKLRHSKAAGTQDVKKQKLVVPAAESTWMLTGV
jgi:hypothetical protein